MKPNKQNVGLVILEHGRELNFKKFWKTSRIEQQVGGMQELVQIIHYSF
jgi:hypothetical protein